LNRIGYPTLIVEILPNNRDGNHIIAVIKRNSHWGALAKSNLVGLQYREPVCRNLREERGLDDYFNGPLKRFSVPVVSPGRPFQQTVWNELLRIPCGKTVRYEDLAHRIGSPSAHRAVGQPNGLNRVGIVIPCHRVVNKNGELGGYGGGLWRKQKLLASEKGASLV
jgi:O-6-methylguanine DNA methyltransferase